MTGDRATRQGAVAFYLLLAVVFCLPLPLGSNRDWLWPLPAAVLLFLGGLHLLAWGRGRLVPAPALRGAWPALALLGLWLLYGLAQLLPLGLADDGRSSLSVEPAQTAARWLQSLFLVTLFVLTLQLTTTRCRLRSLMSVIVIAGLFQAAFGAFMTLSGVEWNLFGPKTHGRGLATGTFVNRNHFAGFLEICLAVGLGRLLGELREAVKPVSLRARLRRWAAAALGPKMRLRLALVIMVIGLVLSRSRMGNSAFFASLLVSGVLALFLMRRPPRALVLLLVSLIVIDLAMVGTWFGVERVVERIQASTTVDRDSGRLPDEDRLDVDAETLAAWRRAPWLGTGGGTFYTVFPRHRPPDVGTFFDHAHNDYLELLLEYGVVGCLPLALFVLLSLAAGLRAMRLRRDPLLRGAGFAVLMGCLAYLLHSTVDFNLHIPANAAYFVLLCALGWLATGLPSPGRGDRSSGDGPPSSRQVRESVRNSLK